MTGRTDTAVRNMGLATGVDMWMVPVQNIPQLQLGVKFSCKDWIFPLSVILN